MRELTGEAFPLWLFLVPEYLLLSDDRFFLIIIGAILLGVGMGWVFPGQATTGGTDTLAALIQRALPT